MDKTDINIKEIQQKMEHEYKISTSSINEYKIQSIEEVLNYLSRKIEDINDAIFRLVCFYLKNSRHQYSKVSSYINSQGINDEQVISYLLYNIERVKNYCKSYNLEINNIIDTVRHVGNFNDKRHEVFNEVDLYEKVEKLSDHIMLEQQRIFFYQNKEKMTQTTFIKQINDSTKEERQKMEEKTAQLRDEMSTSIISVLGIFSAVVMVFFGGLSVLGNILSAINNASCVRTVFICSLTGVITFNAIIVLLYFIARFLGKDRDIFIKSLVIFFNIFMIILMSGSVFVWFENIY